jgi:hypothetical protein
MLESEHVISEPAYKYFGAKEVNSEVEARRDIL